MTKKTRTIQMDSEMKDVLKKQKEKFIKTFGREPEDDDPVFFDEEGNALSERVLTDCLSEAMRGAGVDPAFIYAWEKTGLIVTEMNIDKMPKARIKEWQDAVNEYHKQRKS